MQCVSDFQAWRTLHCDTVTGRAEFVTRPSVGGHLGSSAMGRVRPRAAGAPGVTAVLTPWLVGLWAVPSLLCLSASSTFLAQQGSGHSPVRTGRAWLQWPGLHAQASQNTAPLPLGTDGSRTQASSQGGNLGTAPCPWCSSLCSLGAWSPVQTPLGSDPRKAGALSGPERRPGGPPGRRLVPTLHPRSRSAPSWV